MNLSLELELQPTAKAWYKYNTMKANGDDKKGKKGGKDGKKADGEKPPQEFATQLMSNVISYVSF